jgi:hypothetical protein
MKLQIGKCVKDRIIDRIRQIKILVCLDCQGNKVLVKRQETKILLKIEGSSKITESTATLSLQALEDSFFTRSLRSFVLI